MAGLQQALVPHTTVPLRKFTMYNKGGLPSMVMSLPSGPMLPLSVKIKWGNLSLEELGADPASPSASGSPTEEDFLSVSSCAEQCTCSKDPGTGTITPERTLMPDGKEG